MLSTRRRAAPVCVAFKEKVHPKSDIQTPPLTCRDVYLDQHVRFSKSHHYCCELLTLEGSVDLSA